MRIATLNAELDRTGPGLLLRDILKGDDPQLKALQQVLAQVDADILLLQNVDFDHGRAALAALRDWLAEAGAEYPYVFALPPNTGLPSGLDLDGDGRLGGPGDAQGFGAFFGQGGMALLSRFEIDREGVVDFSAILWKDLPEALLPHVAGTPFPSAEAQAVQRLPSVGHWVVPVVVSGQAVQLLALHAGPPVFDGPEDRNGRRNHDELLFWKHYMDGAFGSAPDARFVLIGVTNQDPVDGDGIKSAIRALLSDPRLQDPKPMRPISPLEDHPGHHGDPRLDTVAWPAPDPGHLRVDYVLPSADLKVTGSGVFWPAAGAPLYEAAQAASRHRIVWVDLDLD